MTGESGGDWIFFRNTGTFVSKTWVDVPEAQDLGLPFQIDQQEWLDRATKFKQFVDGYADVGIDFEITYSNQNANAVALRDAALNRTPMEVAFMDQDIANSGAHGWTMFVKVFGFDHNAPITDNTKITVTLKPTPHQESGSYVYPNKLEVA